MFTRQKRIAVLALALLATSASAGSLVYVVNLAQQFGTIDVATGAFQQIGPNIPEGPFGLAAGPNGSLLTLAYSGNLISINPTTGVTTLVGPTGLADCSTPASPCGPKSAGLLGGLAGKVYATDASNNIYSVNAQTGNATLIGATGIASIPFVLGSVNNGIANFFDETLFSAGGKLYSTFDALTFDLAAGVVTSTLVSPALYQIDPLTGLATLVGSTDLGIGGVAEVNGTFYAFNDLTGEIDSLDLTNGKTSFVGNFDPAAGVIQGASPVVPEPATIALAGIGMVTIAVYRKRKRPNEIV